MVCIYVNLGESHLIAQFKLFPIWAIWCHSHVFLPCDFSHIIKFFCLILWLTQKHGYILQTLQPLGVMQMGPFVHFPLRIMVWLIRPVFPTLIVETGAELHPTMTGTFNGGFVTRGPRSQALVIVCTSQVKHLVQSCSSKTALPLRSCWCLQNVTRVKSCRKWP